ncbi:sialate O-acetylesterase [Halieaceae bacterium IMCC14734]|uniref:Sialate O-acetylesterase n=1 Tax=Candidatus Litorirhabdus singularis TaxID=2518993 RepID=A0ABT3TLG3_9GAMM|nr:GDSL-type esterase/lipase family protein [Candidatus Litorirhabdus singularis]MCX2982187.1 sialate O-acetylesterase [Candidatus Litorirhabdus singularis]
MKTWLIRLSVTLNVLTLAVAAGVYFNGASLVRSFLEPMYERKFSFFDSYPIASGATVFLGDSITEGGEWQEVFPALRAINRGIGGDITTGVLQRLEQVSKAAPERVFLMIGTNDLTHGPDSRDTSYQQYREIVQRLQQESPRTEIFLQSVLPRAADKQEEVEAYNAVIAEIATATGTTFIDLYPAFLDPDGSIKDAYSNDELHLNGPGYQLWQAQLQDYMN